MLLVKHEDILRQKKPSRSWGSNRGQVAVPPLVLSSRSPGPPHPSCWAGLSNVRKETQKKSESSSLYAEGRRMILFNSEMYARNTPSMLKERPSLALRSGHPSFFAGQTDNLAGICSQEHEEGLQRGTTSQTSSGAEAAACSSSHTLHHLSGAVSLMAASTSSSEQDRQTEHRGAVRHLAHSQLAKASPFLKLT